MSIEAAVAQQDPAAEQKPDMPAVETVIVEAVLDANPAPDGNAYRLELQLEGGKRIALQLGQIEALKIAGGLSKPATAGGHNKEVATLVYGMSIQIDSNGEAVILIPRGSVGALEALAIPATGAEQFLELLRAKIDEAKELVARRQSSPKQP
jgi:hypothetical protein